MTQMDPETSKNQIGMLKTFEINDSKPNWQKKIFPYQKCIIHLCQSFLNIVSFNITNMSWKKIMVKTGILRFYQNISSIPWWHSILKTKLCNFRFEDNSSDSLLYTENIYSHIVIWIYQSYGENIYIDNRQTFL